MPAKPLFTATTLLAAALPLIADPTGTSAPGPSPKTGLNPAAAEVVIPAGTKVPLVMVNSVSSKHSQPGDPIYLESIYPTVVDGRILIPAGTHVSGRVVQTKRPGRVKGRGHMYLEFTQMILPNGVIRDLEGRPGALDGRSPDNLDRESGKIKSPGTKGEDAGDIATGTAAGASLGGLAGALGGRPGKGVGIGAAAGGAAGVARVLLTRGPDVVLERGTHIEMLLGRDLHLSEAEVQFEKPHAGSRGSVGAGPDQNRNRRERQTFGRRPL